MGGSAERIVATRKAEERFGTYEPAWSADGKVIAVSIFADGTYMTLAAVTVADDVSGYPTETQLEAWLNAWPTGAR